MTDITTTLNNGIKMPLLGIGTWRAGPGEVESALEYAISEVGLRHIDGALLYGNEKEVGEGIRRGIAAANAKGIKLTREDLFVTTKAPPLYHDRVAESFDKSLKDLGIDYIDLYLVHWPLGLVSNKESPIGEEDFWPKNEDGTYKYDDKFSTLNTWKQMEKVYEQGKIKAIGVSNFSIPVLKELLANTKVVPVVNQLEMHPLLPQTELVKFCEENKIVVEAWRPLATTTPLLFENEQLLKMASKHDTSVGNLLISWHIAEGRSVIPKSVKKSRISGNAKYIELDKEDLEILDNLHKTVGVHRFGKSDFGNGHVHFEDWD